MRKIVFLATSAILLLAGNGAQNGYQSSASKNMVNAMPLYSLSDEQKNDMIFMYEEEKMAKDVYNKMYESWGVSIFKNIANSEQSHQDSIKALLEKYSITITQKDAGFFENSSIQALYDSLLENGKKSQNDAIKVGIDIENVDISDLKTRIERANEDAKAIYENLLNGSYNHLASFESLYNNDVNLSCDAKAMQKATNSGWNLLGTSYEGCSVEGLKKLGAKNVFRYTNEWITTGNINIGEGFWVYR